MADENKYNIKIECGTDFVLPFVWTDDNGNPVDLTGATVTAQLREYSGDPDAIDFICTHNNAGGRIMLVMPNELTRQITYSYGVYDVTVVLGSGVIKRPLYGEVKVQDEVTKPLDGEMLYMIGIESYDKLPAQGITNRLYLVYEDRKIYRWNGTNYIATSVGNGIQRIDYLDGGTYRMVFDDGTYFDFESVPRIMGVYDATVAYEKLDIVHGTDGATYIAKIPVPAGTTLSNATYWQQMTQKTPTITSEDVSYDYAQTHTDLVTNTGTADAPNYHFKVPRGVTGNESIDDDAGIGDDDVVWSADKNATNYKYSMKRLYRDTITDSKLLTSPGFYNVNTSNYTDLTADFGAGVYGILQVWSDPPYQKYQVFVTETGMIATRWVKGDGTQAGAWQKIKIDSLMKVQDRGSITDSKLLTSPGFYWINTSWFTDMSDLGSDILGLLQDWSKPGSQRTQVFISEYGTVATRWVKANGSNAGNWKIFSFDGMMTYRKRGNINDSKLLPSPGFYNVNSSWYTDLTADFGSEVIGILQTWSDPLYQKYQVFTSETGMIAYRVVNAAGTSVILDWKYLRGKKQNFYYAAFGDSRCYGYTSGTGELNQYRYPKYIGDNLNINYGNYGLSGSGLFARPSRDLPDALTVLQENTTALQNNNVNLITIEYGVNDWEHPIGSYTDTGNDTWCGKLYNLTKYISETFPLAHLIVIGSANTTEGTQANDYGYGYVIPSGWSLGGLIREEEKLCAKYHIPFISGFDGPFNNFNIADLMPDTLHFEDEGYLMRSRYLLGKIKSIVDFNNC